MDNAENVKALIAAGADVNVKPKEGLRALDKASKDVAALLRAAGAR